jgi:glycosyltransferase WbpL
MSIFIGLFFVLIISIMLTGLVRKYALSHSIIDIPNERSSHTVPTPRGGGLAIVILLLMAIGYCYLSEKVSFEFMLALGGGILIVAIVGWIDDHKHIPAVNRAIVYTLAAIWAITWINREFPLYNDTFGFPFGLLGSLFIVVGIVWLTNLFNFMDGTDALAGMESICASSVACFLFFLEGQYGMMLISAVIFVSCCGFLFWNWPPAKIFMGDVGSCSLGFCFGILAVLSELTNSFPIAIWFVLLAVFICDATFTLLIRIIRREKWYKAHKTHAYQRLVLCGMSHKKLVNLISAINILILWPSAWLIYQDKTLTLLILTFVIALMFILWVTIQIYYYRTIEVKN